MTDGIDYEGTAQRLLDEALAKEKGKIGTLYIEFGELHPLDMKTLAIAFLKKLKGTRAEGTEIYFNVHHAEYFCKPCQWYGPGEKKGVRRKTCPKGHPITSIMHGEECRVSMVGAK